MLFPSPFLFLIPQCWQVWLSLTKTFSRQILYSRFLSLHLPTPPFQFQFFSPIIAKLCFTLSSSEYLWPKRDGGFKPIALLYADLQVLEHNFLLVLARQK